MHSHLDIFTHQNSALSVIMRSSQHQFNPIYSFLSQPDWFKWELAKNPPDLVALRDCFIWATEKRLMSDAPIGVLLSGGLDSSLVSAIAVRKMRDSGHPLRSFSIGLDENAPDLVAARKLAAQLGTEHHEVHFSVEVID